MRFEVTDGRFNPHAVGILPAAEGRVIGDECPGFTGVGSPQDADVSLKPPALLEDPPTGLKALTGLLYLVIKGGLAAIGQDELALLGDAEQKRPTHGRDAAH